MQRRWCWCVKNAPVRARSISPILTFPHCIAPRQNESNPREPGFSFPESGDTRWHKLNGKTFNVRKGPDYAYKKTKAASKHAFYECFAVDLLASRKKISNISRFFRLPTPDVSGVGAEATGAEAAAPARAESDLGGDAKAAGAPAVGVPDFFMLSIMIPDDAPSLLGSATDGNGYTLVFHFRLSAEGRALVEKGGKDPSVGVLVRFLAACARGGPQSGSSDPQFDRPKAIFRHNNWENLNLGFAHRKLAESFNSKPFLTRPEHNVYISRGGSCLEIDIDAHRFKYFQRRCAQSFRDLFQKSVIDVGLVIEGRGDHEMPERMLAAVRIAYPLPSQFLLVQSVAADSAIKPRPPPGPPPASAVRAVPMSGASSGSPDVRASAVASA